MWFDQTNYTELSARVSREVLTIQRAIGDKFACIVNAYANSLAAFALGFYQGWSLALALLGLIPIIGLGNFFFMYALT